MSQLVAPPVPQGLREMLKQYPELIERLQRELNYLVEKPSPVTPPFERAIWILEDTLDSFVSDAREDFNAAEASGDAEAIAFAKAKRFAVGSARADLGDISDLRAYFNSWSQP